MKCGIIGLPNVGKSSLFNSLTSTQLASVENYPFCTIEPNIGSVFVPDTRLQKIADIVMCSKIIPTQISFIDIAGLIKGASQGEGLGNKFLAHIREVDVICHVLRCFEDNNILHVYDKVNPVDDAKTVETELIIYDIHHLNIELNKMKKQNLQFSRDCDLITKALDHLSQGNPIRSMNINDHRLFQKLKLLTVKPLVYVCNVSNSDMNTGIELVREMANSNKVGVISISPKQDSPNNLDMNSYKDLSYLIRTCYDLLELKTYFTAGIKEVKAWACYKEANAREAAGIIHSDFKSGFIAVQVISYQDYINCNGQQEAKKCGRQRKEGSNYIIQDGDILHFLFNNNKQNK